jgi:archaeosine synthase beta-subunit
MADFPSLVLDDRWIRSRRKEKNPYDPRRPYAWIAEEEYTRNGRVEPVGALFLSNRECPFTCLMCDLWKNTGDATVALGDIPGQIAWGLRQLPPVRQIKLYNSGNFFDRKAIPPGDFPAIAELVTGFQTVIVESHPVLIGDACLQFRDLLQTARLDVAIGLETVHPEVLPRLNKRMDLDDFSRAIRFLRQHGMEARAFILLKPPFLDEREGVRWARRSIDFAFAAGVECCVVIPTRPGNGATDELMAQGYFGPPVLESLEEVLDYGLGLGAGRVFADLWDLRLFSQCPACFDKRRERLQAMNLGQRSQPAVQCPVCRT